MVEFGLSNFFYVLLLIAGEVIHLHYSPHRNGFWISLLFGSAMVAAVSLAVPEFTGSLWLINCASRIVLFLFTVFVMWRSFQDSLFHILNRCVFGWLTFCCAGIWSWAVIYLFGLEDWEIPVQIVSFIIVYGVFLAFSLANHRRMAKGKIKKRGKGGGLGLSIFVVETACILVLSLFGFTATDSLEPFTLGDMIFLSFVAIYLCFLLLNQFSDEKRLSDENVALKQLHEKEKAQFEISKEYRDIINVKSHDMKHLIYGLKGESASEAADEELKRLEELLSANDAGIETGNEALDIVLTEKGRHCVQKGILFTVIADGECISFMDPVDIYSLLGNILDNAIEASEKVKAPEKRLISLFVRKESGVAHIRAENYCGASVEFDENGYPLTVKADKINHGFGTKSIRMTAENYDGSASFSEDDGFFVADVVLPFPGSFSLSQQ